MAIRLLLLENKHDHPVMVILEPVAADYTLLPGEVVEVATTDLPPNGYLRVEFEERYIVIWEEAERSDGWWTVAWAFLRKGDEVLEGGYQREEWNRYCRKHGRLQDCL